MDAPKIEISWYRSPVDKQTLRRLTSRSDLQGAIQAIGHLVILAIFGCIAVSAQLASDWPLLAAAVLLYGMAARFTVNALHELAHGTVFRTPTLNSLFCNVFAFLSLVNRHYFWLSHRQHHRYSLHPPFDQEVLEPELHDVRDFLRHGIVSFDLHQSLEPLIEQYNLALGKSRGEWQRRLFSQATPEELAKISRFSRFTLAGHSLIAAVSFAAGLWIVPVLLLFYRQFGGLPFLLCNNSQHAGLLDGVDDFRLCSRTFYLSQPLRFLYWNMNYHIEHHMYPAVPSYRLARLHKTIRSDLPPTLHGLWRVWKEIQYAVDRQKLDPTFRLSPVLPKR
jgi:fatty acid desaturase